MQGIADAMAALFSSAVSLLIVVTITLLVMRRYMPFLGQPLWRLYQRALQWCIVMPVRVIRALIRAATAHHR
jgi:hypothetical protein